MDFKQRTLFQGSLTMIIWPSQGVKETPWVRALKLSQVSNLNALPVLPTYSVSEQPRFLQAEY